MCSWLDPELSPARTGSCCGPYWVRNPRYYRCWLEFRAGWPCQRSGIDLGAGDTSSMGPRCTSRAACYRIRAPGLWHPGTHVALVRYVIHSPGAGSERRRDLFCCAPTCKAADRFANRQSNNSRIHILPACGLIPTLHADTELAEVCWGSPTRLVNRNPRLLAQRAMSAKLGPRAKRWRTHRDGVTHSRGQPVER